MITLTKLNDKEFILNSSLIETIEENPDTTITTTTGKRIIVKETVSDVVEKAIEYRQKIFSGDYSKKY